MHPSYSSLQNMTRTLATTYATLQNYVKRKPGASSTLFERPNSEYVSPEPANGPDRPEPANGPDQFDRVR